MKTNILTKGAIALASFLGAMLPQALAAQAQWSVLFYYAGDNVPISSINWNAVTHVTVIAVGVNSNGSLSMDTPNASSDFPAIINAAHANGKKALINLNDIGNGSTNMAAAVSCCLSTMVTNVNNLVNQYGFDGIELDWERTLPASNRSGSAGPETSLTQALRNAMGNSKNLIVDVFPCCTGSNWNGSIPYVDRFAMMTYDEGLSPSMSWFNSALYNPTQYPASPNSSPDGMSALGSFYYMTNSPWNFPISKLMLGIPFYGEHVTGPNGPRQSTSGMSVSQQNYSNMYNSYSGLSGTVYDSEASAAWLPISGGYLSFETPQTITNKINYVKSRGAGGWIIFTLRGDYLPSQNPSHPLLDAVATAMGTNTYAAPSITSTSPLAGATVGSAYSQGIGSTGSTPMTWAVTSGSLPGGLSLNSSTGMISGTPSAASDSAFTLQATNAAGTSSRQFSLSVNAKTTSAWVNLVSQNSGKCLDVTGMSESKGVQLQQWTCEGTANQQFQLTSVQGGYEITAKNSGLQLNVNGGTAVTQDGAAIIQWPYSGASNEIWSLAPNADGSYSIKVLSSGKCVDVAGISQSDGALIQQWACWGGANQKWSLVPVQ